VSTSGGLPTEGWHKLLVRQVRRHFGSIDAVPPDLLPFLELVQQAYRHADEDRLLMEHSLETVSRELADRLARMQSAIGEREEVKRAYEQLEATQEQLRQAQKMEAIGQLAGGVAHDFNNLLTVISGNVELVTSTSELPAGTRELLGEVVVAADRATRLTRQLLAYSRKQMLRRTVFDLAETIDGLLTVLGVAAGPRITIETDVQPAFVLADRSQMDQVLLNLVMNARDAMRREGTITISSGTERVTTARPAAMGDELPPGTYSVLRVTDSGMGIPSDLQDRVFEPFFTTKRTGEGTGLGLSMVYGLVRQTGGYVLLSSRLGEGTTMVIYLPASEDAAKTPDAATGTATTAARRSQRLLVVDDERGVRQLMRTVLERQGFAVEEAFNGQMALDVLEKTSTAFDLVVSDVVMPELSGWELGRRMRTRHPQLPILFVSGYSPEELADLGGQLDDEVTLLSKPFSIDQLVQSIRSLIP
jgi:two-component system cell cycle sensor histidine kinase/response regulator CckA